MRATSAVVNVACVCLLSLFIMNCAGNGKDETVHYSYSITQDNTTGWHIIELTAGHSGDPGSTLSLKVSPEAGSNMFSLIAGGHELIDATDDLASLPGGGRGNFILYPTPNRVRNGEYVFMGETYSMLEPGEEKHNKLHGLVRDDTAWAFDEPEVREDGIYLTTRYVIDESNPRFTRFPFPNILTMEFAVMADRARVSYHVENTGDRPLGFGFGLHPYWKAIGSKADTRVQVGLTNRMEATSDLLPTGKLIPVAGTTYDLTVPTPVEGLSLDDVYFGATPESDVAVFFDAIGLKMIQRATADFTHVVVYTPDRDYFCVENQTCSTDAHNLYEQGLTKESHLQVVEPGESTGGHVDYIMAWDE